MQSEINEKMPTNKDSLFSQPSLTIRGGIIGAAITAFLSWNTGKISKIGIIYRKWKLTRNFILPKRMLKLPTLTNYYHPQMDSIMNNFLCFSGQPGIGKSCHFQSFTVKESLIRPSFYIKFKTIGCGLNFESELSQQLGLGGHVDDGSCIITSILNSAERIRLINEDPHIFWMKYMFWHILFIGAEINLFFNSNIGAGIGMLGICGVFATHLWYTNFLQPLLVQSIRRTMPMIILDDLNKMENIGKIPQIARFLKLIEDRSSNVILISSDEDTWIRLRKEPGLKDRLRIYQIYYDHLQVSKALTKQVQLNFESFMKLVSGHRIYKKEVIIGLIQYLIELREITLRRFISMMRLNDEEQYLKIFKLLENKQNNSTNKVVQEVADVFFQSEMETMVANIKAIKRQLTTLTNKQFVESLNILQIKGKLPSDNILGPYLQTYSIVRDQRSQYVFNGRFMEIVYGMTVRKFVKDMMEYQAIGKEQKTILERQLKTDQGAK